MTVEAEARTGPAAALADDPPLPVGHVVRHPEHGSFHIEALIGRGGFGCTYKARREEDGEIYALKESYSEAVAVRTTDYTVRARTNYRSAYDYTISNFKSEARTLQELYTKLESAGDAALYERHIVRVFGDFEANGTAYYWMEFIEGEDLRQYARRILADCAPRELIGLTFTILSEVLEAVEMIHDNALLHRDLKPQNIRMCARRQLPILIDFGEARFQKNRGDKSLRADNGVSPPYAAPELMTTDDLIYTRKCPATDIYSIAVMAYELLTQRRYTDRHRDNLPFPSASERAFFRAVRPDADGAEYTALFEHFKDVELDADERRFLKGVERGLEYNADKRPETVGDWRVELGMARPAPSKAFVAARDAALALLERVSDAEVGVVEDAIKKLDEARDGAAGEDADGLLNRLRTFIDDIERDDFLWSRFGERGGDGYEIYRLAAPLRRRDEAGACDLDEAQQSAAIDALERAAFAAAAPADLIAASNAAADAASLRVAATSPAASRLKTIAAKCDVRCADRKAYDQAMAAGAPEALEAYLGERCDDRDPTLIAQAQTTRDELLAVRAQRAAAWRTLNADNLTVMKRLELLATYRAAHAEGPNGEDLAALDKKWREEAREADLIAAYERLRDDADLEQRMRRIEAWIARAGPTLDAAVGASDTLNALRAQVGGADRTQIIGVQANKAPARAGPTLESSAGLEEGAGAGNDAARRVDVTRIVREPIKDDAPTRLGVELGPSAATGHLGDEDADDADDVTGMGDPLQAIDTDPDGNALWRRVEAADPDAQKRLAALYLKEYPNGLNVGEARQILRSGLWRVVDAAGALLADRKLAAMALVATVAFMSAFVAARRGGPAAPGGGDGPPAEIAQVAAKAPDPAPSLLTISPAAGPTPDEADTAARPSASALTPTPAVDEGPGPVSGEVTAMRTAAARLLAAAAAGGSRSVQSGADPCSASPVDRLVADVCVARTQDAVNAALRAALNAGRHPFYRDRPLGPRESLVEGDYDATDATFQFALLGFLAVSVERCSASFFSDDALDYRHAVGLVANGGNTDRASDDLLRGGADRNEVLVRVPRGLRDRFPVAAAAYFKQPSGAIERTVPDLAYRLSAGGDPMLGAPSYVDFNWRNGVLVGELDLCKLPRQIIGRSAPRGN